MTIISCIKQVQDLDMVLPADWIVQADGKSINIDYANRIMNVYDEIALELMLRLADVHPEIDTGVITIGEQFCESVLRKALAVGAQEAIRIDCKQTLGQTPHNRANLLASVINATNEVELVLCGRQADNNSHGLTGQLLAEKLGWPCFTLVTDIKYEKGVYHLERITEKGIEHISVKGPIVVTITQASDKFLRMATLKKTMEAKKKTIRVLVPESEELIEYQDFLRMELKVNRVDKKCHFLQANSKQSLSDQLNTLIGEYSRKGGL